MELSPRAIAPGDRRSGSYGTRHGWQAPCSLRLRSASGPVRGSSALHRALAAFGSRRSLAGVQAHGSATLLRASRCFCSASVRRPSSVRTTTTGVALARLGQCFFFKPNCFGVLFYFFYDVSEIGSPLRVYRAPMLSVCELAPSRPIDTDVFRSCRPVWTECHWVVHA